ncbi:Pyruvate kinase [Salmonella enterica subsp. enterica serovar Montevideo str. S5-403]|uniref:Pyruvate kinase n=10 Tax=Salmonella enterica TaxID=28901 RepID=G5Q1D0_SALMO|nr:Pyruvate kinase [Salmonella enterica subsp. enterica serovar Montevideo str. S5-403]
MSRRLRRTKIVTTLGPATDRDNNLEKVIAAGANVVRMNFSHGSPEDHKMRADKVREIAAKLGRHVAILGDLQGPKIRVSTFKEGKVFLNIGDKFLLDANLGKGEGDKEKVGIDYKGLPADVVPGDILLLDDGRVQLKVLEVQGMKVFTEVTVGGPLSNNKGINKLGGGLSAEALTEKDKADIQTAALIGVDYLAVSFPRCGEDLKYARRLARDAGDAKIVAKVERGDAKIVAKVERAEAVCDQNAMDDIILASDVVMVARGDLGVEIGDPELVGIQKALIRRARQLNRAVITATQMMESMITNPMPTRAEVMDVANAVLDGTDAVMLSAETAAGQYPSETVAAMARVCLGAEKIPSINVSKHRLDVQFDNVEEAIAMSAMYAANHLKGVTAIITMTESGRTALMTSRISSGLPIFAMSRHERTLNLTALYRGVTPVHFDSAADGVVAAHEAVNLLRDKGYLVSGDLVIVTQGDVMSTVGSTNTTRILTVE